MGYTHDPTSRSAGPSQAFGSPPWMWPLQAERTRMRLLFSFHFRESAGRANYSTDPWRNAQYLCGNVCRHCASREERSSHARLSCTPLVHSERGRSEMTGNTPRMRFWSGVSERVWLSFERMPRRWLGCTGYMGLSLCGTSHSGSQMRRQMQAARGDVSWKSWLHKEYENEISQAGWPTFHFRSLMSINLNWIKTPWASQCFCEWAHLTMRSRHISNMIQSPFGLPRWC